MKLIKKLTALSWTALFAGAIVGVGLNFLLNLFSLALALGYFSVQIDGKTVFSLLGFLWFSLAACISMFFTGWVAGKLTPPILPPKWGILIGFISWSILLMMTIILITNMIQYASFHSNFTANLVAIKLVGNGPMYTETIANLQNNGPLSTHLETAKKIIYLHAFLTFILFFIGGLSSCAGGYLGYRRSIVKSSKD